MPDESAPAETVEAPPAEQANATPGETTEDAKLPESEGTGEAKPDAPKKTNPVVHASKIDAATTASTMAAWFNRVGQTAKGMAVAAGHQMDRAAVSVGIAVEQYQSQMSEAYENRVAKGVALACEERDRHRLEQETSLSPDKQAQVLENAAQLTSQCLTLTGDVQSEIQYASKEMPLGRESYGLMMLMNVLIPLMEHGIRRDWKSILPAAYVAGDSTTWAENIAKQARKGSPSVLDMLLAGDAGWRGEEAHLLGIHDLNDHLSLISSEPRQVQAWLYDSVNQGVLAQRLQTLTKLTKLLDDWYFPWALLRQEGQLTDMLTELVKVESQEGLVHLPLEQLHDSSGAAEPTMAKWTQKMRDTFTTASDVATKVKDRAFEGVSKVSAMAAKAVSDIGADGIKRPDSTHDLDSLSLAGEDSAVATGPLGPPLEPGDEGFSNLRMNDAFRLRLVSEDGGIDGLSVHPFDINSEDAHRITYLETWPVADDTVLAGGKEASAVDLIRVEAPGGAKGSTSS